MARPRTHLQVIQPLDSQPFTPTARQPVRVKSRLLRANTHVLPHQHHWAQMVFSSAGVARVMTSGAAFVLPPKRAVWIPSHVEHAATVLEDADLHSVYVHQPRGISGPTTSRSTVHPIWSSCRVIEVRPLLLELVRQLATEDSQSTDLERYRSMCALVLSEMRAAQTLPLGIVLPLDRRLRAFCESFLADPTRDQSLDLLAREAGASASTIARLFRREIGTSFASWRQQVMLARALTLSAQRMPMSRIATELGYSSASAFSGMVTRLVGMPPSKLLSLYEVDARR